MKKISSWLIILLLFTACGKEANLNTSTSDLVVAEAEAYNIKTEDAEQIATDSTAGGIQFQQLPGQSAPTQTQKTDWSKKIIKTATIHAEIKDFKSFAQQSSEKVKKFGGYISEERQSSSEYRLENSITIKVPVDQFDNAVNELVKDVEQVNERQVNSQDVTSEYVDSKSRLEAKKQVRLRYLELLRQAKNMSEILEVQKEINEIQEEIEMVTGRINYLGHSSAMSTIHFTYYQELKPGIDNEEPGFINKFKTAIVNGWYWIGEIVIAFAAIWPVLLFLAGLIYFIRKKAFFTVKKA